MLDVGQCTRHYKIPGSLVHTMIGVAQMSLKLWWQDERVAMRLVSLVLAGPTNLRVTTGQLSEPAVMACWRLIGLLEYLATLDNEVLDLQQQRCLRFITAPRVTGRGSQPSRNSRLRPRFTKFSQGLVEETSHLSDALRHVPRLRFDVDVPNEVHQANLPFLPHDRLSLGRKTYKYALTVMDVASHYKEAEPLTTKESKEIADALERIYK